MFNLHSWWLIVFHNSVFVYIPPDIDLYCKPSMCISQSWKEKS